MSTDTSTLARTLAGAGYSLTTPRKHIFTTLQSHAMLTMPQLVALSTGTIDRASVYRTVELFEQLGITQRIQIGFRYKLELADPYNPHHHHAVCDKCGAVTTLRENTQLESFLHRLGQQLGYQDSSHRLEIRGTCQSCQRR